MINMGDLFYLPHMVLIVTLLLIFCQYLIGCIDQSEKIIKNCLKLRNQLKELKKINLAIRLI